MANLLDIQRRRIGSVSAALPEWAAGRFTEAQAAAMGPVGLEMLNKRGVCALRLKVIADAAGVSIATTREALNIADTIGLITIERHLRGLYDMRSCSPEWLAALRGLQESALRAGDGREEGGSPMTKTKKRPQPEFVTDEQQLLLEIEDMRLVVKFGDKRRYSDQEREVIVSKRL